MLTYFFHDVLAPAVLLFVRCNNDVCGSSSSELVQALFSAITAEGEEGGGVVVR